MQLACFVSITQETCRSFPPYPHFCPTPNIANKQSVLLEAIPTGLLHHLSLCSAVSAWLDIPIKRARKKIHNVFLFLICLGYAIS